MKNDKLTISYAAWTMFSEDDDYDKIMAETAERGFNCIRIEDGAGLLWDSEGNVRNDVLISPPFGKYTEFTSYHDFVKGQRLNLLERLLKICRAAKKHNIRVILSSWFFLHTNWFCEEKEKDRIFNMSTEEQISYFADELGRILDTLRNENLIDIVAFAEIFNEFDGIQFTGGYAQKASPDIADKLRKLHEGEIAKLKNNNPDILFAYDSWTPYMQEELIPRNIDVLNFHWYYAWPVYHVFQQDIVKWSLDEPEIPESTRYFLKENITSVADIVKEMGGSVKTGLDWPRRISLYSSIDEKKEPELEKLLDDTLKQNIDYYRKRLQDGLDAVIEIHDKIVPNSKLVMGEGATYCASPYIYFERNSNTYWDLLREQARLFNEKGLWGSVVRTNARSSDLVTWYPCKDLYAEINKIFAE